MDETTISERPPLRKKWTKKGEIAEIPITGYHKRITVYGTMNVLTGDMVISDSKKWNNIEFQAHLEMVRKHWRGWNIILFLDRGSPHTSEDTELFMQELSIDYRFLPIATPKMNPIDTLWGHIKRDVLSNLPTPCVEECVEKIYQYLRDIGPKGCLKKSGVLSDRFWLNPNKLKV